MSKHPKPKIVTIPTHNLQIIGKKIDEAISTKNLAKTPDPDNFDYTFQQTDPDEKHATSGGFKIPQGNYGKNYKDEDNLSFVKKSELKENISRKANLSKKDILTHLGMTQDYEQENEFISEPYIALDDLDMLETIKNRRDMADVVINNIERSVEKIQMHRERLKLREKSLKNDFTSKSPKNDENVIIYHDFDRSQIVSHNISTNEKPTVENVEALLMAHKERMEDIQHKYLEQKIKKIDRHKEGSLSKDEKHSLKSKSNISSNISNMMTLNVRNVPLPKKNKKQKLNSDQNFSFMQPAKQITPKNYEKEFRKYIETKNKKNKDIERANSYDEGIYQDGNIKQALPSHLRQVPLNTIPKDELELMQFFFDDIPHMEPDVILKEQLIDYLKSNEKILDLYDINPFDIKKEVNNVKTNEPFRISFKEFVAFLKIPRNKRIKTESSSYEEPLIQKQIAGNVCLLNNSEIQMLEKIYNDVDRHQDYIVPLKEFANTVRHDIQFARNLQEPAIYLSNIEKSLSLEKILYQLEREGLTAQEKREKEYISWKYFFNYLTKYQYKPYTTREINNINTSDEDLIITEKPLLEMMKECFEQLNKIEGHCNIKDLIHKIRNVKRFEFIADKLVRKKSQSGNLNDENLREILYRIGKESDEFVDFDEFLEFFTKRGHPKTMLIFDPVERKKMLTKKINNILNKKNEQSPRKKLGFSPNSKNRVNSKESERFAWNELKHSYNGNKSPKSPAKNRLNSRERDNSNSRINSQESKIKYPSNIRLDSKESQHRQDRNKSSSRVHSQDSKKKYKSHENQKDPDKMITKRNHSKSPVFKERSYSLNPIISNNDKNEETMFHLKHQNYQDYQDNENQGFYERRDVNKKNEEIRILDGYDSDPEYHSNNDYKETIKMKKLNLSFSDRKKKNDDNLKITVPMPFEFDEREKLRKLREIAKERVVSKEKISSFKANPVPEYVKQRDLLEKINKEQELRREEIKKNSRIITMQREKPFSFYLRDIEKQKIRRKNKYERKKFEFKANPVPWFCSVKLFQRMNEQEKAKRDERISKQAQISLNMAKLPPRMEKHEQEKKANELKYGPTNYQTNFDTECTFKPKSPKEVPNFKRLQRTFQALLDNKRRNKRPTMAKSPKFHQSKKTIKRENLDEGNVKLMFNQPKKEKKIDNKPAYQPSSTKKWEAAVEKSKKEREMKENLQREKEKEEQERLNKKNKIKGRVQHSNAILNNTQKLKVQKEILSNKIKEKFDNDKFRFNLWKQEMNDRVSNRPLLVETATNRDKAFEKMKQLSKLHKIMIETGIKNKDIFTPEEQEMIGDLEYLKKHKLLKDLF